MGLTRMFATLLGVYVYLLAPGRYLEIDNYRQDEDGDEEIIL